jgi:hypothetical protein
MSIDTKTPAELALAFEPSGYEQIPEKTVLTRLNYYDGKFLRADSLRLEQDYLRRLAELGARAGGAGLVYGFDVTLGTSEQLTIGGGLGFDAAGRVLYLPNAFEVGLQELLDRTRKAVPQAFASSGSAGFEICEPDSGKTPPAGTSGAEFVLITIAHAENACGEEDVFGKLCDDGCATSTDRAYLLEGVIVRAIPFQPKTPFVSSKAVSLTERHLRSQLASAVFEDERQAVPSRISKAGLLSEAWCTGAPRPTGWEVPIAIVGRLSSRTFVDEWIVRRERIDVAPRRFWAWTMAMRPWESYLAQILQFQCQLPSALSDDGGDATGTDPCAVRIGALEDAARVFDELEVAYAGETGVPIAMSRLQEAHRQLRNVIAKASAPSQRILIDGGIVELPPAGYLPVTPGADPSVQEQVRRLMGAGVDLRFCATTADFVAHTLEEARHMERISLLQGLDDPKSMPKVDVLVPDGVVAAAPQRQALGWDTRVGVSGSILGFRSSNAELATHLSTTTGRMLIAHGAGRSADASDGSVEFRFAGEQQATTELTAAVLTHEVVGAPAAGLSDAMLTEEVSGRGATAEPTQLIGVYARVRCTRNPFELNAGAAFNLEGEGAAADELSERSFGALGTAQADFTVKSRSPLSGGGQRVTAEGTLSALGHTVGGSSDSASGSVDVDLQLDLRTDTTPPTVEAHLRKAGGDGQGEIIVWATWQGTPLDIVVVAGPGDEGDTDSTTVSLANANLPTPPIKKIVAAAELKRSDAVFDDGNPAHEAAQSGLETLASVLHDTRYTGEIELQLFARDAGEGSGGGALTATRDWVLFHRRRIKDCDVAPPPPPPVATTKHLVMFVERERFTRVRSELKADRLASALKMSQKVGDAEFDKDTANLRTPVATLKNEWVALADSPPIGAAVAAASVAAADPLPKDQAKAVALACGGSTLKPLETYAVQGVPTGYDAVSFFSGSKKVAEVGYAVFGTANFDQLGLLTQNRDLDAFLKAGSPTVRSLGTVEFVPGTTNVDSNNLLKWEDVMAGLVAEAVVFTRPSESTSEDVDAQVKEILTLVGAPDPAGAGPVTPQTLESKTSDEWPDGMNLVCIFGAVEIT